MRKTVTIRTMLTEGRVPLAIGRAREVAALVLAQPKKAAAVIECLWDEDPGVASRAADVLERASTQLPSILEPWKSALLGLMDEVKQNKLRWNLALMVARMPLSVPEARRAARTLQTYLEDRSSIVKTAAMQGLADLTRHDSSLLPEVLDQLRILSRSGTPAMRARGRILLKRMEPGGKMRALGPG